MVIVSLTPSIHLVAAQTQREAKAPEPVPVSVLDMALLRAENRFFGAQRQPGCWDGLPGLENGGLMVV